MKKVLIDPPPAKIIEGSGELTFKIKTRVQQSDEQVIVYAISLGTTIADSDGTTVTVP